MFNLRDSAESLSQIVYFRHEQSLHRVASRHNGERIQKPTHILLVMHEEVFVSLEAADTLSQRAMPP